MKQHSRAPLAQASTTVVALVHAQIRRARSLTTERQRDERVRQLAKHELTARATKAVERVVALVADAASRGAPLEECEAVPLLILEQARIEYEAKHGAPVRMSRADAHQLEEEAEGAMEEAETAYAYAPTITNATCLLST